jgi:hypothetical protein
MGPVPWSGTWRRQGQGRGGEGQASAAAHGPGKPARPRESTQRQAFARCSLTTLSSAPHTYTRTRRASPASPVRAWRPALSAALPASCPSSSRARQQRWAGASSRRVITAAGWVWRQQAPYCRCAIRPPCLPLPLMATPYWDPTPQIERKEERAFDLGRALRVFGFGALLFGPYQVSAATVRGAGRLLQQAGRHRARGLGATGGTDAKRGLPCKQRRSVRATVAPPPPRLPPLSTCCSASLTSRCQPARWQTSWGRCGRARRAHGGGPPRARAPASRRLGRRGASRYLPARHPLVAPLACRSPHPRVQHPFTHSLVCRPLPARPRRP